MTERTNIHDDDPAKRAIDLIRAESEDRVLPWSHAETTVRTAYAPLIASVRELLGEIHDEKAYRDVPLIQQIADAIEAVRKERAWHAQIECDKRWLLDQEKQSKATELSLQRQLVAANAEKQTAVDLLRHATNTKYPNAPQELHALAKVAADMLKTAHDGLHEADAIHRELRRQIAERDQLIERQQRELLELDADSFVAQAAAPAECPCPVCHATLRITNAE